MSLLFQLSNKRYLAKKLLPHIQSDSLIKFVDKFHKEAFDMKIVSYMLRLSKEVNVSSKAIPMHKISDNPDVYPMSNSYKYQVYCSNPSISIVNRILN